MLYLLLEGILFKQMLSKSEEKAKNLVSFLTTSTPVIRIREEAVKTTKATDTDGKQSTGEYPDNLARVPCIWYPIII